MWIRLIASPSSIATRQRPGDLEPLTCASLEPDGVVVTSLTIGLTAIRSTAGPERIGCTQQAKICFAPFSSRELNRAGHRTGGVDLVVDNDCTLTTYLADQVQRFGPAKIVLAPLLDDRQRRPDQLGKVTRLLGETDVRRNNDRLEQIELAEVVGQQIDRGKLIDRDFEEPLDLTGMEVDR